MNGVSSISLISVFLFLLLTAFLVLHRSKNRVGNILFASFLLITSIDLSGQFLGDFYRNHLFFNQVRLALGLLQMPLFYFYVKKVCFSDYELDARIIWHSLPAIIFILLFSIFGVYQKLEIVYIIAVQLQYYVYIGVILLTLQKYKRIHLKYHSLQSETYKWLMTIAILFLIGNTIVLIRGVFEALNEFQRFPTLNLGIALFGLAAASWFVLNSMRNPELFTRVNENAADTKKNMIAEDAQLQEEVEQLYNYMNSHKPYLEEALTLQDLAAKTEIPAKRLSLLINQKIGKHFFDFINDYRIEESKKLLQESELTIQQIMYEVGFNSKSSFNTAFKKNTSLTPSIFRKQSV
ncbi:AraC family transcriptional regulator [Marivirga sp.]|uniref:helix-turn-helix domain-containing protein n=1 Tax=Marivirga sp. TaxID=2018662 RepID=UPI0025DF2816|nr:helix-turn-helix domain-containing protein [Marivirga sp.]